MTPAEFGQMLTALLEIRERECADLDDAKVAISLAQGCELDPESDLFDEIAVAAANIAEAEAKMREWADGDSECVLGCVATLPPRGHGRPDNDTDYRRIAAMYALRML